MQLIMTWILHMSLPLQILLGQTKADKHQQTYLVYGSAQMSQTTNLNLWYLGECLTAAKKQILNPRRPRTQLHCCMESLQRTKTSLQAHLLTRQILALKKKEYQGHLSWEITSCPLKYSPWSLATWFLTWDCRKSNSKRLLFAKSTWNCKSLTLKLTISVRTWLKMTVIIWLYSWHDLY